MVEFIKGVTTLYSIAFPVVCSFNERMENIEMSDEDFDKVIVDLKLSPRKAKLLLKDLINLCLIDRITVQTREI